MNRIAITRVALVFVIALLSASCSGGENPQNRACVTPPGSRFPWVYYPGYGCGPLTPTGRGVFAG